LAINFAPGEEPELRRAIAAARAKLQSGKILNSAERVLLGMSAIPPSPTTSNFDPNFGNTISKRTPPKVATPAPAPAPAPAPSPAPEQVPVVQATPAEIPLPPDPPVFSGVKAAPIDTVVFADESYASEFISDLLFEDIGGIELLSMARSDTVNGQQVLYQPIKNLGILRDTFNINSLLRLQETSDRFFANFMIRLNEKIPNVGSGENGANYYLDLTTGDGVIELINMRPDEQVELQIANAGTIEDVGI
jgi:hypothetical protein